MRTDHGITAPGHYSTLILTQGTPIFIPVSSLQSVFPWTPSCCRGSRAVWSSSSVVTGSREYICGTRLFPCRSAVAGGGRWRWSQGGKTVTACRMEQKPVCTPRGSALHVPPWPTSSSVSLPQPCFFHFCPVYPHHLQSASGPFSTLQPQ